MNLSSIRFLPPFLPLSTKEPIHRARHSVSHCESYITWPDKRQIYFLKFGLLTGILLQQMQYQRHFYRKDFCMHWNYYSCFIKFLRSLSKHFIYIQHLKTTYSLFGFSEITWCTELSRVWDQDSEYLKSSSWCVFLSMKLFVFHL